MCIYWLYYVTCSYIYFITHAKLKNTAAPLKTGLDFSSLRNFFFSLNNTKKKMYANVLEMFSFDSKTSIRRYPIFLASKIYHKSIYSEVSYRKEGTL